MQYLEVFTVDYCGGKRRTVQLCIPDVPNLQVQMVVMIEQMGGLVTSTTLHQQSS
jgi:hypothetical protein